MLTKNPLLPFLIVLTTLTISCSKDNTLSSEEREWLQDQDEIVVAIYPYHPPYQILNKQGEVDGIFSEYLALIEEKIDYTFRKKVYNSWPKVMDDLLHEKIDIVVEIHPTESREKYLNFYALLFESPQVIVTRTNESHGNKLSDFENKTIALPQNYAIKEILKQKNKNLAFSSCKDDLSCLQELNDGQHDAYIGPQVVINYLISKNGLDNLEIKGDTKINYKSGIAVFKKNKELNNIIEKASNSITITERQAILDNWIFNVITPFYEKTIFWVGVSITILLVLFAIVLINRYLNFKIRQKTKELIIARDLAEESNKLKTAFIQNISHEVRTPINGIMGFTELLNDPENTPEQRNEFSNIVIQSSKQLIRIIDDIIEISRLQTNQVELHLEEVNFDEQLEELFGKFKDKADHKGIEFRLKNTLSEEEGVILMDKLKIGKILDTLIDNAIKFTKKGLVEIFSEIKNENLIVQVKDTGIGIKPEDQEIIFRNFSQSEKDPTKSYDGLGLGLSIAQKNAELIKGIISFTSVLNEGSSFMLSVPHHPVYDASKQTKKEDVIQVQQKPIKQVILIVEDRNVNFVFLRTVLLKMKNYKFVIYRAENGKEAINLCRENNNIDLVLMDIKMPIMDGFTATKRIKKIRPNLPIVAQTAYSTEEDIQKALEAGCDDFVSKPISRKRLKPIIGKYF